MRAVVVGALLALRQVRVHLRGRERLVAKELLHRAQVRTVVQQVRRERVADGVRADVGVEADLHEILGDLAAHRAAREARTVLVHEERRIGARDESSSAHLCVEHVEVVAQALQRVRAQRHEALAAALATDHDALVRLVQVATVDGDDLAHADTRRVERLEDRAVARAQQVAVVGRREQALDLVHGDRLGKPARLLRRADQGHRVRGGDAALFQPLVEGAERGDLARHRGGRVVLLGELREEAADALDVAADDRGGDRRGHRLLGRRCLEGRLLVLHVHADLELGLQVLDELTQVEPVAPRGVRTESTLIDEVGEEALDDRKVLVHGCCLGLASRTPRCARCSARLPATAGSFSGTACPPVSAMAIGAIADLVHGFFRGPFSKATGHAFLASRNRNLRPNAFWRAWTRNSRAREAAHHASETVSSEAHARPGHPRGRLRAAPLPAPAGRGSAHTPQSA